MDVTLYLVAVVAKENTLMSMEKLWPYGLKLTSSAGYTVFSYSNAIVQNYNVYWTLFNNKQPSDWKVTALILTECCHVCKYPCIPIYQWSSKVTVISFFRLVNFRAKNVCINKFCADRIRLKNFHCIIIFVKTIFVLFPHTKIFLQQKSELWFIVCKLFAFFCFVFFFLWSCSFTLRTGSHFEPAPYLLKKY